MNKIMLIVLLTLSCATFGQQTCIQTGPNTFTCYYSNNSNSGGSGGSGTSYPSGWTGGGQSTSYSAEAYAQMLAAQEAAKKAEEVAKRAWCKANNYPSAANTSFCAVFKKEACISNAMSTQQSCESAYNNLNSICNAYVGILGGAALSKFLKYVGIENASLGGAITVGTAALNVNEDTTIIGCNRLVPSAMAYCKAGAEKMKNSCN